MEYQWIELAGYRRLKMSVPWRICIQPRHRIQLIFGTNGCGKSSLLREITPLPGHPSAYEKGGYKVLRFEHRNANYESRAEYDGKIGRYFLSKNGVSLFTGTTITDYRTLLKEELQITPETHALVNGTLRFSDMDVARRRQWFTLLNPVDYGYALQFYRELRSRIRDLQGALSVVQSQSVDLERQATTQAHRESLSNQHQTLKLWYAELLDHKPLVSAEELKATPQVVAAHQANIRTLVQRTHRVTHAHYSLLSQIPFTTLDAVAKICDAQTQHVTALQTRAQQQTDLVQRLTESIPFLPEGCSESQLAAQLNACQATIETIERGFVTHLIIPNAVVFQNVFSHVFSEITDLLRVFPYQTLRSEDPVVYLHREKSALTEQVGELQSQQTRAMQVRDTLLFAKRHHQRTCPACQHVWYEGYHEEEHTRVLKTLEQLSTALEVKLLAMDRLDQRLEMANRADCCLHRLWSLPRQGIEAFWDGFDEQVTTPAEGLAWCQKVQNDVVLYVQRESLQNEKHRIETLLSQLRQTNLAVQEEKQRMLHEEQRQLAQIQEERNAAQQQLRRYQTLLSDLTLLQTDYHRSLNSEKDLLQKETVFQKSLLTQRINAVLQIVKETIVEIERAIDSDRTFQDRKNELNKTIARHTSELLLLQKAESALSPSKGLIARGVSGFINAFISQMNAFVETIWTYPLKMLPVHLGEEGELDYRFPLQMDEGLITDDLRADLCNRSTCEIFNLAFRWSALVQLQLADLPLQLDEFDAAFDNVHRNLAFQMISRWVFDTNVPQVFLVSHNEKSYTDFSHCDIIVLHAENISTIDSPRVNQTVVIE